MPLLSASLRDALRIPAAEITGEDVYRDRRRLLALLAASPALGLAGCGDAEAEPPRARARPGVSKAAAKDADHARRLAAGFTTDEERTRYEDATTYNNFFEFGTGKADPARAPKTLRTKPWRIRVHGECEKPGTLELEDLIKGIAVEERVYRLRCVEGWSMVIPWLGVPLAAVLKRFAPTSKAKYVAFTSLADPVQMPWVQYKSLDFPYREGLRMDEAMHPLTMLATGLYGKTLPQQNGAPVRLLVPWKYGIKNIKSIVEIRFSETMPISQWNKEQPGEYGFYSNVNPYVDHPRWSQKTERRISGTGSKLFAERIPTRMFNGYAEQVEGLYRGMDLAKWF